METYQNLEAMLGVWESVNLNPAIIVSREYGGAYRLTILHVDIYTRQAHPAVHPIESDDQGMYIGILSTCQRIEFDAMSDTLHLSVFGEYIRN